MTIDILTLIIPRYENVDYFLPVRQFPALQLSYQNLAFFEGKPKKAQMFCV